MAKIDQPEQQVDLIKGNIMKLKDLLKENILGQMPSEKLMKMKWNPLAEANPDGTISPNEDKEMQELLDHLEESLEGLLYEADQ